MQRQRNTTGIDARHSRACAASRATGTRCTCRPTYQAEVYSPRDRRKIRKTFPTLAAAKVWRADALVALRRGTLRPTTLMRLRDAAEAWYAGAARGTIRNRSGDRYKPSTLRGYEQALRLRVLPSLGHHRLSEITRNDVQDVVDRLVAAGHDASTVRNTLLPLRAIFRRAVARGDVALNPTHGVELPAVRGRRERVVSPEEALRLVEALRPNDRALWATALFAGLRLGELRALRWEDVDLAKGVIRVERSWDPKVGPIDPKSRAGRRRVPVAALLRDYLIEHKMGSENSTGLVFGSTEHQPFNPSTVNRRAATMWRALSLESITLHEARHTFASLMIAAGVNAKALSSYMGHSSVTITYDRYGHLLPGNESEAAELLDSFMTRSRGGSNEAVGFAS